jgi:hypothetical protein
MSHHHDHRKTNPDAGESPSPRFVRNACTVRPLEVYASSCSVFPGEAIAFHARAAQAGTPVTIAFSRYGQGMICHASLIVDSPDNPPDAYAAGCRWPASYTLTVPPTWPSGIYVATLTNDHDTSVTTEVAFAVKARTPSSTMLWPLMFNTAQAYNSWGGKSLYPSNSSGGCRSVRVSFDRPYDDSRPHALSGWEAAFVEWLDAKGIDVDVCASADLADPSSVAGYRLLLSVGHDEYWSKEMRDTVEGFIASGGNFAFFSGNPCWWQARLEDNNRTLVCYKWAGPADPAHCNVPDPETDPSRVTVNWKDPPVNRPENVMTGVSHPSGSYWNGDQDNLPAVPYRVLNADPRVFAGTGLAAGDTFGQDDKILGLETDAPDVTDEGGVPVPTFSDGTPTDFLILAFADLRDWPSRLADSQGGWATMGLFQRNGTVFTAATENWALGLHPCQENAVAIITENVLRWLSGAPLAPCPG